MTSKGNRIKLKEAYQKVNEKFESVLVFHVGESAGFFSEYNCMILVMLYCLQHKIQFKLYSRDANFGYEKGWTDFFESFCKEEDSRWHHWINMRPTGAWLTILKKKDFNLFKWKLKKSICNLVAKGWKFCHPNVYLTQDVWNQALLIDQRFCKYDIPELNIKGDISQACKVLVEITWGYREDINEKLHYYIRNLQLNNDFISCQIRAGDKYVEYDLLSINIYIEYLKKYPDIKNIFVLTDDYSVIMQLETAFPQWNWYTLCGDNEHGYVHAEFKQNSKIKRKEQLIKFFASIEIIHLSNVFLGTVTSNPSIFSSLRDSYKTCFVDYDKDVFSFVLS